MKNHSHHSTLRINSAHITVLVLTFILIIAGVFTTTAKGQESIISESAPDVSSDPGSQLVLMLNQLHSINLDQNIFRDKVFQSFQDFGLQVVPEPQNRNNPFAPIGTE
jgi:hypothetical protein